MYIDIYIDSFILTYGIKKIHFLLPQIEKKNENMKKKIIYYLIDYACPIISDNRLWNFSDCTSLVRGANVLDICQKSLCPRPSVCIQ